MEKYTKNWFKYIVGFVVCLLIRLIPFRPPNIEPILATNMPFSKAYGPIAGFGFAFMSILLFDIITGHYGVWSYLVAGTYGMLGFVAYYFFRDRKPKVVDYVYFAIAGTIIFDAFTGLAIGPIFFHQSFSEAFLGQIPFTLWHLLGNIGFAVTLSPAMYEFVIQNENLESIRVISMFTNKKIS
ncbi:MAG: ECF transporter S component [Candidatus Pacebacteria bacterium]|nr:ECF transporter S component [Candidatus Paceibacterota bacterium]